jgi:hypothetical protein
MREWMPSDEQDDGGLTLGTLADADLDERFRWLCADSSRLDAIDSAIERARDEQGLEAPITREDVAHAFAWNLDDLARRRSWRSERFEDVWSFFEGGGRSDSRLHGLIWSVACEQRIDWHPERSRLDQETAQASFERFRAFWQLDGLWGAELDEEFYAPHWGPGATERYLGVQHPADRIKMIARSLERREQRAEAKQAKHLIERVRASGAEGLDAFRAADIAPRPRADRIGGGSLRAGELGDGLRELGAGDLLLAACRRLASKHRAPKRALYLWLYHAPGFRQVDMVAGRGRGFTTTRQSASKEMGKGEWPFWSYLRDELTNRIEALSGGDGEAELAARLGRLRDRIAERLQQAGG